MTGEFKKRLGDSPRGDTWGGQLTGREKSSSLFLSASVEGTERG